LQIVEFSISYNRYGNTFLYIIYIYWPIFIPYILDSQYTKEESETVI